MISAMPSAIMTMERKQECPLPFPGKKPRQTISALMCAGVLRGGFLHTTSERGEGYIAYKLPKEKMGLKTMWPIACGMLHNSTLKRFLQFGIAIKRGGATASLDVENETAIQGALSRLIKNKTVLIIAHLMRTVAGADQVVVLSGGIVAEQGSPAELYARKGLYTHMVDLQSASQNWTI